MSGRKLTRWIYKVIPLGISSPRLTTSSLCGMWCVLRGVICGGNVHCLVMYGLWVLNSGVFGWGVSQLFNNILDVCR